ncbi:hypothetical protein N0V83_009682 [Neocucurbitaria cava]|uniref:Uncharacterized protein n=1 Tax=Neocucurbitaria cava TaxID=798079 RepID=A0A9W9CI18_9PLEO|nr:hypothetical protein N0V83_009682 [Neocucurbitaria cava]
MHHDPLRVAKRQSNAAQRTLISYLGATSLAAYPLFAAAIPVAVTNVLGGLAARLGSEVPMDGAYQYNGGGVYSSETKWVVLPNALSGPGVVVEAWDFLFSTSPDQHPGNGKEFETLKQVLNQPYLLKDATSRPTGRCQRNTYFFGNATAQVVMRSGNVTLGPAASNVGLTSGVGAVKQESALKGVYEGVRGFSACAQLVGYSTTGLWAWGGL